MINRIRFFYNVTFHTISYTKLQCERERSQDPCSPRGLWIFWKFLMFYTYFQHCHYLEKSKKKNPKSTFTSYPMRLFKQLDKAFLPFSSLNSDLHRSLFFHNSTINKENPTSTWLLVLLLLLLCTYSCFWSLLFYYWLPLLLPQRNNTAPLPLWKKDCHVHSTNQAALNLNQLSENSLRRSSRKTLAKPLAYCVFISMTALFR